MIPQWEGFETGLRQKEIDVRDFIQQNCAPYEGDESFLARATERTKRLLNADDVARIASFAAGLENVERVDILPFHQMGRFKWKALGLDLQALPRRASHRRSGRASQGAVPGRGAEGVLMKLLLGIFLLVTAPVMAQEPEPQERDTKNEITVFGGVSILDASGSSDWTFGMGNFPAIPGFPMFPGFPGRIPEITARGESSLGSSALFGARYSRQIKDRLALEGDFAIAPAHDFEAGGELCLEGYGCFGDGRRFGGRFGQGFERDVTAWHYGGGIAYDLTGGDVRPLLLVGAGGVTWDGASETDFVFRFGAGLKILFGRLGARIDVVDHLVVGHFLSGGNEHDVHATAGFLVGF